jgi:hypothetical protein
MSTCRFSAFLFFCSSVCLPAQVPIYLLAWVPICHPVLFACLFAYLSISGCLHVCHSVAACIVSIPLEQTLPDGSRACWDRAVVLAIRIISIKLGGWQNFV